jgi:hypothetical protein
VNRSTTTALERIDLYLTRVRCDLDAGDREQALDDAAVRSESARQLWGFLANDLGFSSIEMQLKLAGGGEN